MKWLTGEKLLIENYILKRGTCNNRGWGEREIKERRNK